MDYKGIRQFHRSQICQGKFK